MSDEPTILDRVILLHSERSEAGLKKYGTDMGRVDYLPSRWAKHLQEELADALVYSFRVYDLLKLAEAAEYIFKTYDIQDHLACNDIAVWRELYRKQCDPEVHKNEED